MFILVDPQEMWLPIVFGEDPKYFRPLCTPKLLLGENIQLKPTESVSAYVLTTDKAIATKLDQTIKGIELYKNLEFGDNQVTRSPGSRDLLLKFWDPFHILGTVEEVARNFKFGTQIGHWGI